LKHGADIVSEIELAVEKALKGTAVRSAENAQRPAAEESEAAAEHAKQPHASLAAGLEPKFVVLTSHLLHWVCEQQMVCTS